MKKCSLLILLSFISVVGYAQPSIKKILKKYNTESIPYITVDSLLTKENYILLDAREKDEFAVSHIKNALFVGYDFFKIATVTENICDKNAKIIVYCSIGVRSEDIAERLKNKGYTNVFNLYGGIFEWKNKNNPVYDSKNIKTNKVHAYSKYWGKLLTNAIKIY